MSGKLVLLRAGFVIVGLAAWFGTQQLIGARSAPASPAEMEMAGRVIVQGDKLLQTTAPAYEWFAAKETRWQALLIASSAMIDILGFSLLGMAIFGRSIRPFLGLLMLFALRQTCQAFSALPPPEGMIWENPGFPSLLVTYGVSNDLFFSGHTAIAVFGAVEIGRGGRRWQRVSAVALALFLVASVVLVRAHYMMDIFAGTVTALLTAHWATWLAPKVDRQLARFVGID
ncbi:MAG: sphingomyelin synthase family protein [Pirellulales bacterium]|nr:sphingomyelin synthase family protein [Pirellulales bacterium]